MTRNFGDGVGGHRPLVVGLQARLLACKLSTPNGQESEVSEVAQVLGDPAKLIPFVTYCSDALEVHAYRSAGWRRA